MIAKRGLRWLGAGLILFSIGLLARGLMQSGQEVAQLASQPRTLALALVASLAYAASLALPAAAWACALRRRDRATPSYGTAIAIYARCNILKYLPGNVFHFGGRQVLARRAGWPHRDALLATMLETALLPLAAGWVALLVFTLAQALPGASAEGPLFGSLSTIGVDAVEIGIGFALACAATFVVGAMARRHGLGAGSLGAMAMFEVCFFAASAVLIAGLALAVTSAEPMELATITAAYLASWVIGFVVPGAPGGLGVREAAFVQLAATAIPAPAALTLGILARLVTSLGDLWFALFAQAATPPDAEAECPCTGAER